MSSPEWHGIFLHIVVKSVLNCLVADDNLKELCGGIPCQDSGLEPEDPNKELLKEPSLLPKAMIDKRFQHV